MAAIINGYAKNPISPLKIMQLPFIDKGKKKKDVRKVSEKNLKKALELWQS